MKTYLVRLYALGRHAVRRHGPLLLLLLVGIGGPWFVFGAVAEDILESGGFIGDQAMLRFFHAHATPALDQAALALTTAGGPAVMTAVGALVVLGLRLAGKRTEARFFFWSVGGAVALNVLTKVIFGRPRPALWLSIDPATFYSFPSGHAMGAAALATALGFLVWQSPWRWPLWAAGGLFALGVGLSRVYLGVHYPSDVLAGWVGSVGWVTGLHLLFSPYFPQLREWLRASWVYFRS